MASKNGKTINSCIAEEWLEEDKLMLLECWSRDGYTLTDIANRIGISLNGLRKWRDKYPEINKALNNGREIIDYKVENALLKSALGYHTKEVKVTTTMRYGKVVETIKEVTDKEQSPNVSAIQCWLYNRLPKKWKKNRDQLIELDEEDASVQITVTRASKNESTPTSIQPSGTEEDEEWQEEINQSVTVRNMTEEEKEQKKKDKKKKTDSNVDTKVQSEAEDDLDYWPDDWEDEDQEEWEE